MRLTIEIPFGCPVEPPQWSAVGDFNDVAQGVTIYAITLSGRDDDGYLPRHGMRCEAKMEIDESAPNVKEALRLLGFGVR